MIPAGLLTAQPLLKTKPAPLHTKTRKRSIAAVLSRTAQDAAGGMPPDEKGDSEGCEPLDERLAELVLGDEEVDAGAIEAAFQPLQDHIYSDMSASVVSVTQHELVWRLALTTSWSSCTNQQTLPLLDFIRVAKVNVTVSVEKNASCLAGR